MPRSYSLADAIRDEFERTHPRGKNTLLCLSCRRRLDREDFRETPWHGRAADCQRCEGMRYLDTVRELYAWQLDQERARVRGLRRGLRSARYARDFASYAQRYALGYSLQSGSYMWETCVDTTHVEAASRDRYRLAWLSARRRAAIEDRHATDLVQWITTCDGRRLRPRPM